MKKQVKTILWIVIMITVVLAICSYFYIGGKEFEKTLKISDTTEVIIVKEIMDGKGWRIEMERQEVILNSTQKEMLKSLFKKTHFRRVLSSSIQSNDSDSYYVTIKDDENGIFFRIHIFGGKYLYVASNYENRISSSKFIKSLNPWWKSKIEDIIVLSDTIN